MNADRNFTKKGEAFLVARDERMINCNNLFLIKLWFFKKIKYIVWFIA